MRKLQMTIRLWEDPEFQARQLAFEFGYVARAVVPIIKRLHRKLGAWFRKWAAFARPAPAATWLQIEFNFGTVHAHPLA